MTIATLLSWLDAHVSRESDLCLDSRQIRPGDVFFACPGIVSDGRSFIAQAVQNGAAAIVVEAGESVVVPGEVPMREVEGLSALLGELAHQWYDRPSDALTVIAVTGTNGKTTTVQWMAAAMNGERVPCGTIGTLGVTLADGSNLGGALTTPDVLTMHRALAAIARAGGMAAAIEASSIGIEQGRLDGVRIQVAGFTNLTRDHLDYHGTLADYKRAKFALFGQSGLRSAVMNIDDAAGAELFAQHDAVHRVGYSLSADKAAAIRAEDIQTGTQGLVFNLATPQGSAQILTHLVGEHNISNLLLVAGVLRELGWGLTRIARSLATLHAVPGRLQRIEALGGASSARPQALVIVDYAHTPDALERALSALRGVAQVRGGRLLCVFGCGGDRDHGKRPLMGEVAERLADQVLLTTDNPRTEKPDVIVADILSGMSAPVPVELDRARAILSAIWQADDKDVVLLAGKGHETYQEIQGVRNTFDDRQWAGFALTWERGYGLSTDSRSIQAGEIFLALEGEHFDGHAYLAAVQEMGASAAIVARPTDTVDLPQFVLGNTQAALTRIASVWRETFSVPVVAVTGSNGKTTTKEMISAILAAWVGEPRRLASHGNFNNAIGVPLSVLGLQRAHRTAVFELGMNHPGEIALLAAIAQPTVALVNNAQREHQEFMGTVEAVALENGAVIEALPASGVAVFPGDEIYTPLWERMAGSRTILKFGFDSAFDVHAEQIQAGSTRTEFRLCVKGESIAVMLNAPGRHNLRNALAAAASAYAAGASLEALAQGLAAFCPVGGRMQPQSMSDGFQLIDDSYNANPDSVRAAIDVLADLDGRKILILGDMAEVGEQGPAMHAEVGAYAAERGIDYLLTLGEASRHAVEAFGEDAAAFDELDALLPKLLALRPGHVLIKGSRSMRMERIVHALQLETQSLHDKESDHAA